jgi:hypothetical protein
VARSSVAVSAWLPTSMVIGGNAEDGTEAIVDGIFEGALDEVLLYDRVLTSSELADLARGGAPPR